ncbi:molybdate ABC transporter substrate-binding protein [Corynebacterium yudongzhengii]|uniref:Molybdate ABC transporter substrate-binding protein n=1 Tax=Corynebacterium yudongzhengii TaxID=2080740 RepID=A0A2U1T9G1_9CORY|nr:molybdate ABC transporter substrate-binding protein [Corynebacterium yudongzhengii]AWB82118.1 molybdate ABC transporter substrate-binding protein [Corynebacterium yudongzhengii]PWC02622.1 molybdate ABC transporter substrate-binding protein [Corynebacterium yudongzhengii]
MKRRVLAAVTALLTGAGALTACATGADENQLTLFAASSTRVLNEGLEELAADHEPAVNLEFNNDGSSGLVSQLAEGAPADILITADEATMETAVADGTVGKPRKFAYNELVMVVHPDAAGEITSITDATAEGVDLILCDAEVPCGRLSETLAEENDLDFSPVSLEHSVGDVLGKVVAGEADAGWVYRTDAHSAGDDVTIIDIPHAEEHPNTLYAAVVENSQNPEAAEKFLDLLTSEEVAGLLEDAGFHPAATN